MAFAAVAFTAPWKAIATPLAAAASRATAALMFKQRTRITALHVCRQIWSRFVVIPTEWLGIAGSSQQESDTVRRIQSILWTP
jgi:hypothetical protein